MGLVEHTFATDEHTAVTLAADADLLLGLVGQQLQLDTQLANLFLGGPAAGPAADPTFRALVAADLPAIDHGLLTGLPDDDHAQYVLSAGRVTGQVVHGGLSGGEFLRLRARAGLTTRDILIPDTGDILRLAGLTGSVGIGLTSLVNGATANIRLQDDVFNPAWDFNLSVVGAPDASQIRFFPAAGKLFSLVAGGPLNALTIYFGTDLLDSIGFVDNAPSPTARHFEFTVDGDVTMRHVNPSVGANFIGIADSLRVGSLAAPVNVTPGDITGIRLAIGNQALANGAQAHIVQPTLGNDVLQLTSTATNDDPTERVLQGRVATTDATVTTLLTIPIPASMTVKIQAVVTGRRTGGVSGAAEDGAGYTVGGNYKTVAGVVTLIGALLLPDTAEDQAAWDATLMISGANVLVRVTGAAGNNVTWHCTARVWPVGS